MKYKFFHLFSSKSVKIDSSPRYSSLNFDCPMNLDVKPYKAYAVLFIIMMCSVLSACHKPLPEEKRVEQQKQNEIQNITPDLNLICERLQKEMQQMSAQRTTFALQQINQDIRICLPLMPFSEQKKLMQLADQMYAQFLKIDRSPEQQAAFDLYAHNQSQIPTIQQSQFEHLHIRDQYLLRHKGQAYIDLVDADDHKTSYQRNAQYLAKVFAPYFPDSEKEFMQELAAQNQKPAFKKNTVLITPDEMSRRAQFWENYLKKFPKSSYKHDAQYLLNVYSSLLFIGLENSPVSVYFNGHSDIQAASLTEIERLAEQKNSRLADQARLFLKFIEMDNSKRLKTLGITENESGTEQNAQDQLQQYLYLKAFDFSKSDRACFTDAICR